jgi:hypothetical protein
MTELFFAAGLRRGLNLSLPALLVLKGLAARLAFMGKVSLADILKLEVTEHILTEDQCKELDHRLEDYHQFPNDSISWDCLKNTILAQG